MQPQRLVFFRCLAVAAVNGLVTLVILLIAPLGLAAVLTCTALVALSSLGVALVGDSIAGWLLAGGGPLPVRRGRG
ncbi:CRISPR-associated protein Csx18 [Gloeobacter morelensis]|uniref:Uncharacterized protein n=1 Tax=Gloeobacter morelensis MG652769 TaxID=2781736 RepID=A0ABY3PIU9_9CYAN|nr:CRISPR-associated protein Csx18 [Gloeobacter morelensis]UFP93596.1 hypothetical protein ISF26_17665 [Gloeobacter morelensis MG652769]